MMKRIGSLFLHALILFLFAFFVHDSHRVTAQANTTLSVLPAESEVELISGDSVTVDLWVTNAVELNAFDITLIYDPNIVHLDSWAYGDLLNNSFPMVEDDQPGSLQVAATQFAQPAVSGDGSLLRLTFSGVAVGQSPLTLDSAVFAEKSGTKTTPDLLDGAVEVWRPRHTLTGRVTLQGKTEFDSIPVSLGTGINYANGPYNAVTDSGDAANLLFDRVVEDTYPFTTQQPRYLNIHAGMNIEVTLDEDTALPDLHLMGGNAVWTDNVIDISDASVVGAMYGLAPADLGEGAALDGDVNFDGLVNIQDLAIVAGNYGLTSEAAYAGWAP
jgi:hypothetical protein